MSFRLLKMLTILIPPLIIGGFEFIRHDFLLDKLSMEDGNVYITIITLLLSYLFATWMFRTIEQMNHRLAEERARRAVYEERERLARELHDNIAQVLFFLNVNLKQGKYDEAKMAITEMDNTLRQAIFNLRSPGEKSVAFVDRLTGWLSDWEAMSGIEADTEIALADNRLSFNEEVQLFGIIQEAFTNIRKHSQATRAKLVLTAEEGGYRLVVTDNGRGFDESDNAGSHTKYGLSMIGRRCEELGAAMNIRSTGGRGTELTIWKKRGDHHE